MARAMSASLASARMKSLQPCGSAWMRASLRSRDFSTMVQPTTSMLTHPTAKREGSQDQRDDHLGPKHGPKIHQEKEPGAKVDSCPDQLGAELEIPDGPETSQDDHREDR